MTIISRRSFLQMTGVAIGSTLISSTQDHLFDEAGETVLGRPFKTTPVFRTQKIDATSVRYLWPDVPIPVLAEDSGWYQVNGGYVLREAIQPMYQRESSVDEIVLPTWGEVCGAVASVRSWCAADAPLVTRIGHGGVIRLLDYLPGEPFGWFGVGYESGNLLGWSQASNWVAIELLQEQAFITQVRLKMDTSELQIYQDDELLLTAPFSSGKLIAAGSYTIQKGAIGSTYKAFEGVPWRLQFGDYEAAGAYWHNQFGKPADGTAVQITPLIARWVYESLHDESQFIVE